MFKLILQSTLLLAGISLIAVDALALDQSEVPEKKRTRLGLYMSSQEAASFMKNSSKYALFLDVRDPHELQTTGMAAAVDYNVPFYFINTDKWDEKKSRFQFDTNPEFVEAVKSRFKSKGLSGLDTIIIICTSGTRAAKAVDVLADAQFRNVHSVVDGYKGWKNNDLEWSRKLDRSRMYGPVASVK